MADEALAALRAAELGAARAAVAQWEAALAVWESTPVDFRVGRRPQALAEIASALRLSELAAAQRVAVGEAMLTWPLLRSLLLDGRLGVPHVLVAVEEAGALGDEALAGRVLQRVLAFEGRLGWDSTPGKLRAALQVTAVAEDPQGAARRRHERQAAESRVRLRARPDGLADLTATGSAEKLLAADRLIDVLAVRTGPDDGRTLGQRQVDAVVAALADRAGVSVPLELQLQIPVRLAVAGVVAQDDPDRTALPEPLVVVTDLGPELLDRLQTGPVAPGDEDSAAPAADVVPHDALDPEFHGADLDSADLDSAGGRAPRSELEHSSSRGVDADVDVPEVNAHRTSTARPASTGRAGRHCPHAGVPCISGHGPIDPARLVELLSDPAGLPVGLSRVQVRRVLVDRTGQAVAVDPAARPLARLLADPRGLLPALLADLPDPPPRTDAYRPSAPQQRVARARDRCCTFPGCARRAARTDLDHRVRFPDGPTSTANLHVLCRHHHRLKHDGWQCVRQIDGTTTWTSPRGQVLRTHRS